MTAEHGFSILDPVLTADGLGRIVEFDTGGDGRPMAKVGFGGGTSFRWYDINKITFAL